MVREKKMAIFSEATVVWRRGYIVLLSGSVKTCGLYSRGNCSCGQYIMYVLDSRDGII